MTRYLFFKVFIFSSLKQEFRVEVNFHLFLTTLQRFLKILKTNLDLQTILDSRRLLNQYLQYLWLFRRIERTYFFKRLPRLIKLEFLSKGILIATLCTCYTLLLPNKLVPGWTTVFFPLLLIPSSRDISPTPIIQRLSSSSSCLPLLPERAAFPPLHSSRTANERNYGESLQTPHGFLNDGRRRGFQFERKLVEDKLVMKIHEEAGSVPN